MAMESSLIQADLAFGLQQLDNIQYHHQNSVQTGNIPGDPFALEESDMMYLPEVVGSTQMQAN